MIFHVVIDWLSLGHFNVFVPFMMGINGVKFRLGKVVDNASTKRISHYIDWRSHPVPTKEGKGRGWMAWEEEKVGHGSLVSGTVTAFVSGSLRYLLDREMGAFKGNGKSWLSQGTCSDREDVQTVMSQLLILREFGKERMLDQSQTAELCLTDIPQCRLLELEVSISGCPAHTTALCLIWIYQSTELNAAREKDFGPNELFSFLVWINKRPLPLLLVSKLWGTKMPEISP